MEAGLKDLWLFGMFPKPPCLRVTHGHNDLAVVADVLALGNSMHFLSSWGTDLCCGHLPVNGLVAPMKLLENLPAVPFDFCRTDPCNVTQSSNVVRLLLDSAAKEPPASFNYGPSA